MTFAQVLLRGARHGAGSPGYWLSGLNRRSPAQGGPIHHDLKTSPSPVQSVAGASGEMPDLSDIWGAA